MNILEAVYSEKPFAFKGKGDWLYVNDNGIICYLNTLIPATFTREAILGTEWIVKEEWYEGDFKKKHPYGVLCKAFYDERNIDYDIVIIIDYKKDGYYPFKTKWGSRSNVEPISPEEAPDIIGKGDKNDKC